MYICLLIDGFLYSLFYLCITLGVKVRNMEMDFNTGGTFSVGSTEIYDFFTRLSEAVNNNM